MKKKPIVVMLLFVFSIAFSQKEIRISYGESIRLGRVFPGTQFSIVGNSVSASVKANEINNYRFEKPGKYTIKVTGQSTSEAEMDEYLKLPDEITVNVNRVKMAFDGEHITFTTPIRKNVETSNIQMSVPVTITTYDHKPFEYTFTDVNSEGIGAGIVAHPATGKKTVKEGKQVFTYSLNGIVTENSYLMFDFVDSNDRMHAVSLLTRIKD